MPPIDRGRQDRTSASLHRGHNCRNTSQSRRSDGRKRRFERTSTCSWWRRARISSSRSRRVDRANRIATTIRTTSSIARRMASYRANVKRIFPDAIVARHRQSLIEPRDGPRSSAPPEYASSPSLDFLLPSEPQDAESRRAPPVVLGADGCRSISVQSARDAIEEWCRASRALPRRAIRPVRAAGRGRPDADVAHRLIAVGDCPIALLVRDSLREGTRSHHSARARAIHTAPRAASVTEPRRESTRMRRSSFRTFRGHSHSVACGLPTRRRHHRVHLYSNAQTRVSDCRMLSASVIASPIWRL